VAEYDVTNETHPVEKSTTETHGNKKKTPAKFVTRYLNVKYLIFLMALFLNTDVINSTDNKIYQICGKSISGHAISLPKKISCIPPKT